MKKIIVVILFFFSNLLVAQFDSINKLEEIVLKGNFSPSINSGYSLSIVPDSVIDRSFLSLGNLLQNQANLYFKQNGNGMVSSISLRGTSASQTAVYWNGIPINSALNGQTDFNTISGNGFNNIVIRRGGGSVLLGSGAIGGAINLTDKIVFGKARHLTLMAGFGSYNTYSGQFIGRMSSEKVFVKLSLGGIKSDNDYPYFDSDIKNENGEVQHYNFNGTIGLRLNSKHQLNFYTAANHNDRNNSRTLTAESESSLINKDQRFMIDWKYLGDRFTSSLKQGYLLEKFTYYFDQNQSSFSTGQSKNYISKYDLSYFLNKALFFTSGAEYQHQQGQGSNFDRENRDIFNLYALFHHQLGTKLNYNLSVRKGFSSDFDIPFIYALDLKLNLNNQFTLKTALSTNYRNPTFNDLYWQPGGNPDLKSERSKSAEIGMQYMIENFKINITSFYIKSSDLIQWQPSTGDIWRPKNIQDATNHGIEFSTSASMKINKHFFDIILQYDYTVAEDNSTHKQLIYVPFHKANGMLNYQYKKWSLNYNIQYTGKVYITTTNSQSLDPYLISNIEVERNFYTDKLKIGFMIKNLFNERYQSVAYRPMPDRNFTLNIKFNL